MNLKVAKWVVVPTGMFTKPRGKMGKWHGREAGQRGVDIHIARE